MAHSVLEFLATTLPINDMLGGTNELCQKCQKYLRNTYVHAGRIYLLRHYEMDVEGLIETVWKYSAAT